MKILKIIHGYPMRYNAGSEVYSQLLTHALSRRGHNVEVFTREEDPFAPDYQLREEVDSDVPNIKLSLINLPLEKHRYSYREKQVAEQFSRVVKRFQPDVIHIGHLNHLALSILDAIPGSTPIIYTLHDYWLLCPRGQLIQRTPEDNNQVWPVCGRKDHRHCAKNCFAGYFSGADEDYQQDILYWEQWIAKRMHYTQKVLARVDLFIAPSRYLMDRYMKYFSFNNNKIIYLDYGFNRDYFIKRNRQKEKNFIFGYIGTHIPAKGIQHLIKAFGQLKGNPILRIWGRQRGQNTMALKRIAESLPEEKKANIEWLTEYQNSNIVADVFNHVDAIVVPSIWFENSPLVIHEAQQARVPVITADIGGMSEYVQHEVNGLLFKHRSIDSLSEQMQRFVNNPEFAIKLGEKGYIYSENGDIPSIEQQAIDLEKIYAKKLKIKKDQI